jgi:hypothetical protein
MLWQILTSLAATSDAHGRKGKICRGGHGSFFSLCAVGAAGACDSGCSCNSFSKTFHVGVCRGDDDKPIKPCKNGKDDKDKNDDKNETESIDTSGSENDNDLMMVGKTGSEKTGSKTNKNKDSKDKEGSESAHKDDDGKPCDPGTGSPSPTVAPGGGTGGGTGTIACGVSCSKDSDCASGFCNPAGFPLCPTSAPGQPLEGCQLIPPDPTQPSVCAPMKCKANNTNPANCACK